MSVRREHFTPAEKSRSIEEMIRDHEPLTPLYEVCERVERARLALLEAAKIADANQMPAIHMPVTAVRLEVERCQQELTSWTARDGS